MPIPKRWFPKSRDFNDDPEGWELTDTFGDRTVRLWDEVCAILDKTENQWPLTAEALIAVARKVRISPRTVFLVLDWMFKKHWLSASPATFQSFSSASPATFQLLSSHSPATRQGLSRGSPEIRQAFSSWSTIIVSSPNYWKYRKKQESKTKSLSPDQGPYKVPSYPNRSEPSFLKDPPLTPPKPVNKSPDQPTAEPAATVLKKQLDAGIKAVADRIYQSDKIKFARLIGWIKMTQGMYSDNVIADTLTQFEPFAKDIQNWYPYLSKIAIRVHNAQAINKAANQSNFYKHQNMEGVGSILTRMAAKDTP